MDLAGGLGEQKFHWILVVHDHGDPAHNQALDQASDYFHDLYGGTMLHLFGLTEVQACYDVMPKLLDQTANEEDGFTVHAGAEEHSEMLFLHPELVNPAVKSAAPLTAKNFDDLYNLAEADAWPGYFGAPARASAAIGRAASWSLVPARSTRLHCEYWAGSTIGDCPGSTTSLIRAMPSAIRRNAGTTAT